MVAKNRQVVLKAPYFYVPVRDRALFIPEVGKLVRREDRLPVFHAHVGVKVGLFFVRKILSITRFERRGALFDHDAVEPFGRFRVSIVHPPRRDHVHFPVPHFRSSFQRDAVRGKILDRALAADFDRTLPEFNIADELARLLSVHNEPDETIGMLKVHSFILLSRRGEHRKHEQEREHPAPDPVREGRVTHSSSPDRSPEK